MGKILSSGFGWRKYCRTTGRVFYGLLIFLLFCTALILAVSAIKIPGGLKIFSVLSSSMEPTIKQGAVVFVKSQPEYHVGDIITVSKPADPKTSVTHRISKIERIKNETFFVTKGDANNSLDSEKRSAKNTLGKVVFSLPFLGYGVTLAKTREGFIFLVIIPATLIIYKELISLKNEIFLLHKKIGKAKKAKEKQSRLQKKNKNKFIKLAIESIKRLFLNTTVLIIITSLPLVSLTKASLTDSETTVQNHFSAGTLDLSLRNLDGMATSSLFNLSGLKPGEKTTEAISVRQEGIEEFQYTISALNITGDQDFCQSINIETKLDGVINYSGALTNFTINPTKITNKQDDWSIALKFDDSNLTLQNKSCNFNVSVKGWQLESDNSWGLTDEELIIGNSVSAGEWENSILTESASRSLNFTRALEDNIVSDQINLILNTTNDPPSVTFTVFNISRFTTLSYLLTYDTSLAPQGISGTIDLQNQNEFSKNNLILGSCSEGGTCVYHQKIKNIKLTVFLRSKDSPMVVLKKEQ